MNKQASMADIVREMQEKEGVIRQNDTEININGIIESLSTVIAQKVGHAVSLSVSAINESTYSLKSGDLNTCAAFSSVVVEDTAARFVGDKFICEFSWKYVEKGGRVIVGERLCSVEMDRHGNVIKQR